MNAGDCRPARHRSPRDNAQRLRADPILLPRAPEGRPHPDRSSRVRSSDCEYRVLTSGPGGSRSCTTLGWTSWINIPPQASAKGSACAARARVANANARGAKEPGMCPGGCLNEPLEPIMSPFFGRAAVTSAGLMLLGAASFAQTAPSPGPIKTPPPVENPSGKSIVINPTEDAMQAWLDRIDELDQGTV